MAEKGWIAVQRKIQTSFVWTNPFVLKLWLLCLFKASHNGNRFLFNGTEVRVDRGQFVTGRVALAKEYNEGVTSGQQVSPTSLNRWLNKFRKLGMLDIKSTTKYSVVTVINYDLYQPSGQQVDSGWSSSEHQVDTIKNANNAKKDKTTTTTTTTDPFDFYQQNGFGMISSFIGEDMNGWLDDFKQAGASAQEASAIIVKSLQIAVERGKTNWGYAKAILKDWDQHGLHSIEAIDAAQAKHNANRQSRKSSSKSSPDVYRNHDFTDEDAKW